MKYNPAAPSLHQILFSGGYNLHALTVSYQQCPRLLALLGLSSAQYPITLHCNGAKIVVTFQQPITLWLAQHRACNVRDCIRER